MVSVRVPTILRCYTGGAKVVESTGETLSDLIDHLETDYRGFRDRVISDQGELHRFLNVYVNDEDVRYTGSLATPLADRDSVTILPAVAGG